MARMMHFNVAVPNKHRMPRFGMGSFYAQTKTIRGLGNVLKPIPLSFYRTSGAFLPVPMQSDLTSTCPVPASGQACPSNCPGKGSACPVHGGGLGRFRMPKFGLRGLGQAAGGYTDSATGWQVSPDGYIFDSSGYTQFAPGDPPGAYGPFTVDTDGSIFLTSNQLEVWQSGSLTGPPASVAPAPVTASAKPGGVLAPIVGASGSVGGNVQQNAGFFAPPTGYATTPTAATTSWWNQSTTLFGATLKNSDLVIGGLIAAGVITLSRTKKR
jgi:hypothetical protein